MIQVNINFKIVSAHSTFALDVNTEFQSNAITRIIGPSGIGKTTLLKMIAGLMTPHHGSVIADEICWFDSGRKINKRVQERHLGFVFQDYALFPNMTVEQHLKFATSDREYIKQLLEIGEMQQLAKRLPNQLSGGQQQRLAILRALATKPRLLLMDEPFSALDPSLKSRLIKRLHKLFNEQQTTVMLVTHLENEMEDGLINSFTLTASEN